MSSNRLGLLGLLAAFTAAFGVSGLWAQDDPVPPTGGDKPPVQNSVLPPVGASGNQDVDSAKNPESPPAAAQVFSGPQPGEPLPDLKVWPLFEDAGDGEVVIVPGPQDPLQLVIFVHERTRPGFAVMRGLLGCAGELGDRVEASVVFLTDDVAGIRQWANGARRSIPSEGVRMCVSPDGPEGPGAWGLNRNVGMTVVLGAKGITKAGYAIVQPGAAVDVPVIGRAIFEAVGAEPPGERQIAAWTGQRSEDRGGQRGMGNQQQEVDIRRWLSPVIQKTSSAERIHEAAAKLEAAAETDPALRSAVGLACRRVVESGRLDQYGNETSQVWLRKWSEAWGPDPKERAR